MDTDGTLKRALRYLYVGRGRVAKRFRYGLIAFDAVSILFFVVTAAFPPSPTTRALSYAAGVVIVLDFSARLWIAPDRRHMMTRIYTLADLVVLASLVAGPFLGRSLAFLRILRG